MIPKMTTQRKKVVRELLLDSHNRWNSDVMMDLSRLVQSDLFLPITKVNTIDPSILSLVVDGNGSTGSNVKNIQLLQEQIARSWLLLFPVFHKNHWSLLALVPSWKQWFHNDSVKDYHRQRVIEILARLSSLSIVPSSGYKFHTYQNLPEQKGLDECGSYCLYYTFLIMRHAKLEKQEAFMREHTKDIDHFINVGNHEEVIQNFVEILRKLLV